MADVVLRDNRGRFATGKQRRRRSNQDEKNVSLDHNYVIGNYCDGETCVKVSCENHHDVPSHVDRTGWRVGRRFVEFETLLSNLKTCSACGLGPVPLTAFNLVGEVRKGLAGYLFVRCENINCRHINRAAYGKFRHHVGHQKGMPCFDINTKLGTAMIDNIGGPRRVNNFLTTLNVPPVCNKNLKVMERRAGEVVEMVADLSARNAAQDAYQKEMMEIAEHESSEAAAEMEYFEKDLGVGLMLHPSPSERHILQSSLNTDDTSEWTDVDEDESNTWNQNPKGNQAPKKMKDQTKSTHDAVTLKARKRLSSKFTCKTRRGMSCAVDTAWQKRGFDSSTSHTFFMSKKKFGNKVVKAVVKHKTCGTCKWWKRNRPGCKVRKHRCVANHSGSSRMMESVSGEQGLDELHKSGTPVEFIEGDGDSTLMARVREKYPDLKKRYDKNHVVKNVTKAIYNLQASKKTSLSKIAVQHIKKCLSYSISKNQGNETALKDNLKALIPHQFGDHSLCQDTFCGEKKTPGEKYVHKSLPHKMALKDDGSVRSCLEAIIAPVAANAGAYADIGCSQQCEHANREVTLRAPKSHHYGDSESLDFRVKATAACINEGRHYICQAYSEAGLSPGMYTQKYADQRMKERVREQYTSSQPSTKRRRLILKQERATNNSSLEVMEGATYQSGIDLEPSADIQKIPDAVPRAEFKPVACPQAMTVITMDLETTDLIRGQVMPHITQIAAEDARTSEKFNIYVIPKRQMSLEAQQTTGIVFSNGTMTVNGTVVEAVAIETALNSFCEWLKKFKSVVLLAHNGRRFDYPVLVSTFVKNHLFDKLEECVVGCVDSLAYFKRVIPDQKSYKQVDLVANILKTSYNAHDAMADVSALKGLYNHVSTFTSMKDFIRHSFSVKDVNTNLSYLKEKANNLASLNTLITNGVCKSATAENIAGSGLNINHLQLIYQRDGQDGLLHVFQGKNAEGQPRVTNNKRVLETVIPKLAEYFSDN